MNTEAKKTIEKELCECSRIGRVDKYETVAILDAVLKIWDKMAGCVQEKDLYEGVLLAMDEYKDLVSEEEKIDIVDYYASFPKELIKGFKMEGSSEEILADFIALAVDKAVEKGYKESKKIAISDKATYKADMEKFEEEKTASAGMREMIQQMGGQAGLDALNAHLMSLAKKAIATQREYFHTCVDNIVKMHANIAIAAQEREENGQNIA
ncbi:MAG: hypothetical protein J6A28_01370 [Clostridia bacterium]|nr:hypothetical protein [Clostridia bacterium]